MAQWSESTSCLWRYRYERCYEHRRRWTAIGKRLGSQKKKKKDLVAAATRHRENDGHFDKQAREEHEIQEQAKRNHAHSRPGRT